MKPAGPIAGEDSVQRVAVRYLEASLRLQDDLRCVESAHANLFYLRCLLESGDRAMREILER